MTQARQLEGAVAIVGTLALTLALVVGVARPADAQILIGETSARFDWEPAPGAVGFYQVYVSRSIRDGSYELEQTVSAPDTSVVIQATAGEVVRVRVRAGNDEEFGPMSPASEAVRFGLPPELPPVGTPGVVTGRVAGSDTASVFYMDPETGVVQRFSSSDPGQAPVQIGTETDTNWQLVASGDFDGDGAEDLFWEHPAGATRIWYLDASGYQMEPGPAAPGLAWNAEITGDFDGNGQDDVFWRDPAGPTLGWFRTGVEFSAVYFPLMPAARWEILTAGDFDGDGLDDLFWRDQVNTDTVLWLTENDPYNGISARVRVSSKRSLLWELFETRDEDGDGFDDVRWRLRSSHDVAEWWHMEAETVRSE